MSTKMDYFISTEKIIFKKYIIFKSTAFKKYFNYIFYKSQIPPDKPLNPLVSTNWIKPGEHGTVLPYQFLQVSLKATHNEKDGTAWEGLLLKDGFMTQLSSRTPSTSLLNRSRENCSCYKHSKSQGGWEWRRMRRGANVSLLSLDFLINW